ncbi:MAG: hypothetical protein M3328_04295 [Chloroflexota bacterium]|nr:hypothetical protein [Chloroflexota bacterium]
MAAGRQQMSEVSFVPPLLRWRRRSSRSLGDGTARATEGQCTTSNEGTSR